MERVTTYNLLVRQGFFNYGNRQTHKVDSGAGDVCDAVGLDNRAVDEEM